MKLKTFNTDGSAKGEQDYSFIPSFEGDKGLQAIKEVITAIRANQRQGNAKVKSRAEVSGSGKKPYRQKGTGMARQGNRRSPILTGGGRAFGPKPRDYSKKLNKKVKSLAFKRSVFDRSMEGSILVIEAFTVSEAKTKNMVSILKQIAPEHGSILLVDVSFDDKVVMAARNIADVDFEEAAFLNTLDLAHYDKIVISEAGLNILKERMEADNS